MQLQLNIKRKYYRGLHVTYQALVVSPTSCQVDDGRKLLKPSKMIVNTVPFHLCLGLGLNEEPKPRSRLAA